QDFFFAPTWLTKRAEEWGMAGFEDRVAHAWHSSSAALSGWMKVVTGSGPHAVKQVFLEHLVGKADPAIGNVLSLNP
ncbi:MAG: DUF2855 family protein, partial [Actinomycetota bacterium]